MLYIFLLILILFLWLILQTNHILNKTSDYDVTLKTEKVLNNLFIGEARKWFIKCFFSKFNFFKENIFIDELLLIFCKYS